MKIAKAKGHLRGKQPKLNRREAHLVALLLAGQHSTAELADLFNVGGSTVYGAVAREQARMYNDTQITPTTRTRSSAAVSRRTHPRGTPATHC